MKVAIVSDIHDNLENLKKFLEYCKKQKIDSCFCCGDVTNIETVNYFSRGFKGDIFLVRGNMEIFEDGEIENIKNIQYFGRIANFNYDGYRIGMCHEPFLIEKVLEKNPQIIFYGHTHKPWIENRGEVKTVNPGTLAGMFQSGTFAFWDTKKSKLELKRVEDL